MLLPESFVLLLPAAGGAVVPRTQVVLLGLLGPKAGENAAAALADRMFTLAGAVVYAVAVLAVLPRPPPAPRAAPC